MKKNLKTMTNNSLAPPPPVGLGSKIQLPTTLRKKTARRVSEKSIHDFFKSYFSSIKFPSISLIPEIIETGLYILPNIFGSRLEISTFQTYVTKSNTLANSLLPKLSSTPHFRFQGEKNPYFTHHI